MSYSLDDFRGSQFYGTAELADVAALILRRVGATQERGTVTEIPEERTVRYYLSEGLIPEADDKQGLKSVFGFRHLLAILVIKQLQSEHLPIRKIREIIGDMSEPELERLLGPEFGIAETKNDAKSYLEGLLTTREPPRQLRSMKPPPAPSMAMPSRSLRPRARQTGWQRFELFPGVEINIADDFRFIGDRSILEDMVDEFRRLLTSRR